MSASFYAFSTYTNGFYIDRVLDKNPISVAAQMRLDKLTPLLKVKDLTAITRIH